MPPRNPRSPAREPELAQNFLTPGLPATDSWPRQQPPAPATYQQGPRRQQPNRVAPARGRPARHTGRIFTIALLLGLFVVAGAGAVVYELAHRTNAAPPPPAATKTVTVPPPRTDPATIVREYFAAINAQRYYVAWKLTPESEPYKTFVAGFVGTQHDKLTIQSVSGDVVTARLAALQTSGIVKYYEGKYVVTNGVISGADVRQVS
jgi:hypothetical protein